MRYTEADSRVFFTNGVTLGVGKEHVGRETTLWRIRIYRQVSKGASTMRLKVADLSFSCHSHGAFPW